MARQGKLLPARRRRDAGKDDSILLRSAESLGRMIGTLQRELDDARRRFGDNADDSPDGLHDDRPRRPARKATKARTTATRARKKTTTAKRSTKSAAGRKATKRTRSSR